MVSNPDSALVENFSSSDSNSDPPERGPHSPSSDIEQHVRAGLNEPLKWPSKLIWKLSRSLNKRRAKKLFVKLVTANSARRPAKRARAERYDAAIGLLRIANNEREGRGIVARRFVKTQSRRTEGIRALLELSDDELNRDGCQAIDSALTKSTSTILLEIVMQHTKDSIFFEDILPALEVGTGGVMAIFYLAARHGKSFFHNVDPTLIFDFGERVVDAEKLIRPRWYCGVRLLYTLFGKAPSSKWKYSTLLPSLLSRICYGVIMQGRAVPRPGPLGGPGKHSAFHEPRLLPLVALCLKKVEDNPIHLPNSNITQEFFKTLINIIQPEDIGLRRLSTDRAWAIQTLILLLEFSSLTTINSYAIVSSLGDFLMDMALYPWVLEVQEAEDSEKELLKHFTSRLDHWCLNGLCWLPGFTFSSALTSALNQGILQLDSLGKNPYAPFSLVERLLWLSNIKSPYKDWKPVYRALVHGGACGFLIRVLSHTGNLDPQDRGLWRGRGLAMTCLGNIVEGMDAQQFQDHVKKDMIDAVVAIKEHDKVPLVQKGQAIFMLQRYTLTAKRCGFQPFYREDVSNMAKDQPAERDHDSPNVDS